MMMIMIPADDADGANNGDHDDDDNDYAAADDDAVDYNVFLGFLAHTTEIRDCHAMTPSGRRRQSSPRSYTPGCRGYAS